MDRGQQTGETRPAGATSEDEGAGIGEAGRGAGQSNLRLPQLEQSFGAIRGVHWKSRIEGFETFPLEVLRQSGYSHLSRIPCQQAAGARGAQNTGDARRGLTRRHGAVNHRAHGLGLPPEDVDEILGVAHRRGHQGGLGGHRQNGGEERGPDALKHLLSGRGHGRFRRRSAIRVLNGFGAKPRRSRCAVQPESGPGRRRK